MSLKFDAVEYGYAGGSTLAVAGASLDLGPGEAVALVGANGSGKSTLMLLANGILRPAAGTVLLDGRPVDYSRAGLLRLRSQVGVVFQDPRDQLFSASVAQDLSLGPVNLGLDWGEVRRRVADAAERCGLAGLLDRPTHALSGGEQARAALAGVLAMRPRFLFADELTNSLDPWMRANVLDIFDGLTAEGCTVVLATHDLALARRWSARTVWMDRGAIRRTGPTSPVLAELRATDRRPVRRVKAANPEPSGTARAAVVAVSFGTTHRETLDRTIGAVERDLGAAFRGWPVRRAFTSTMVIERLARRDGIATGTVAEAARRLADEGVGEVVVQPLHLLRGSEYHRLLDEVAPYAGEFERLAIGMPLLASPADHLRVAAAVGRSVGDRGPDEAVLLMGHGSSHPANGAYAAFDATLHAAGYERVLMATVEGTPTPEEAFERLDGLGVRRVTLVPFMLVAGEHALVDMAGPQEGSWRRTLERRGYEVTPRLTGLGELADIRRVYVDHALAAAAGTPA